MGAHNTGSAGAAVYLLVLFLRIVVCFAFVESSIAVDLV